MLSSRHAQAMTLATLLSTVPLGASGPLQLVIYDIHALQERFYFGQTVCPVVPARPPTVCLAWHM